jgi:hypothetical protein
MNSFIYTRNHYGFPFPAEKFGILSRNRGLTKEDRYGCEVNNYLAGRKEAQTSFQMGF